MLTMFALMLQTATLDADAAKAAITCAQAVTIADAGTRSPMQLTSQFTYLMMQAAKAKPEGTFFEQISQLSQSTAAAARMSPDQAKPLAPVCNARFPIARSAALARLPSDPFRRDVLCFSTLSVLQGAAEEIAKEGDDAASAKIKAAIEPLTARLNDAELKKRGLDVDQKFTKVMGDEMLASLPIGNPLTIAAACGVSLT